MIKPIDVATHGYLSSPLGVVTHGYISTGVVADIWKEIIKFSLYITRKCTLVLER